MTDTPMTNIPIWAPQSWWTWLLRGTGGSPGWKRLITKGLCLDVLAGALGLRFLSGNINYSVIWGVSSLLVVGVLLAFICASSIVKMEGFRVVGRHHENGVSHYLHLYQTAFAVVLGVNFFWALKAGLGEFFIPWVVATVDPYFYSIVFSLSGLVEILSWFLLSVSFRWCWVSVEGIGLFLQLADQGASLEDVAPGFAKRNSELGG